MSAEQIWDLAVRLDGNKQLHADYLIRKMGFDPQDPQEVIQATQILLEKEMIVKTGDHNYSMWPQICLMIANESDDEYKLCMETGEVYINKHLSL